MKQNDTDQSLGRFLRVPQPRSWLVCACACLFVSACVSPSYRQNVVRVKDSYYAGNFAVAASAARQQFNQAGNKDRLLWLLEAGLVLHSAGRYKESLRVFGEADRIAETIRVSLTSQASSFLLNDTKSNFRGELYELVLIKMYLAMNHLLLNQIEEAKRYFRKVAYVQRELKLDEGIYMQNLMARYMDVLTSEYTANYNDARVQLKNVEQMADDSQTIADRYVLALKEGDRADMQRYRRGQLAVEAFDKNLNKVNLDSKSIKRMGELVVINQAGMAPVKVSRGRISQNAEFQSALMNAIQVAAQARGKVAMVATMGVMIGRAEHPVPVYREQSSAGKGPQEVFVNGKKLTTTRTLFSFADTARRNYTENYNSIVTKNVASLATKFVVAYAAAHAVSDSAAGSRLKAECASRIPIPIPFVGAQIASAVCGGAVDAATGAAAGAGVAATIAPDLRSWTLVPDNFQVKRIFLEAGEYDLQFLAGQGKRTQKVNVRIEAGKPYFVSVRTLVDP